MSKILLNNKWFDTEDKDYQEKIYYDLIKNGCPNKDEFLIISIDPAIHKDSYCIMDSKNFYDKDGNVICDKDEEVVISK